MPIRRSTQQSRRPLSEMLLQGARILTIDAGSCAEDAVRVAKVGSPFGNLGRIRSKRRAMSVSVRVGRSASGKVDASSDRGAVGGGGRGRTVIRGK